ncbi:MAG: hypothetical protein O3C05_00365 [Proteobacteria bacterium]|nr:hypothetical protein [Pseudomonadota bacterium]
MLGISISELAIVCISAILLLERSEMQYAIRSIVNAIYKMKKSLHEAQKRCISELNIEMQNNQKDNKYYIMSSDGKKYEAYDMPNHNLKKIASNDAQKQ